MKDINKKRKCYLSMFLLSNLFLKLWYIITCSRGPDNVFLKTLDMLVNDQLNDSYAAQHWR